MTEQQKFNQKAWAVLGIIANKLWLFIKVFFIGIPVLLFLLYAVADNIYTILYHPIIYVVALGPSFAVLILSVLFLLSISSAAKFLFSNKYKNKEPF